VDAVEEHPMPFNAFLHSGALVLCSLLGRAHLPKAVRLCNDSGSRFARVMKFVRDMAGGMAVPVGFSKPTFLSLKQRGLKVQSTDMHCARVLRHEECAFVCQCVSARAFCWCVLVHRAGRACFHDMMRMTLCSRWPFLTT
jgi:hypothetical protein